MGIRWSKAAPDVGAYKVVPKRVCECCDKRLGAAVYGSTSVVVSRCNGGNVDDMPLRITRRSLITRLC